MSGHIQRRGKNSWRLKFDAERDPITGLRKIQYQTFRGTRAEAKAKLIELLASVGKGTYVEPNKITVAEFVRPISGKPLARFLPEPPLAIVNC